MLVKSSFEFESSNGTFHAFWRLLGAEVPSHDTLTPKPWGVRYVDLRYLLFAKLAAAYSLKAVASTARMNENGSSPDFLGGKGTCFQDVMGHVASPDSISVCRRVGCNVFP